MTAFFSLGWQWLVSATLFVGCLVYLILLSLRVTQNKQVTRQLLERIEYLEDQLQIIRRELSGVAERSHPPESPEPVGETAYAQAMRLAGQGLDSSAVAAGCGISRGEAELIVALYRASQRP
ncbi:DUF2802 domain-containing protein [Chitinimonas sp. BJB300]|uniref:DUF2802 domain-containing protein n=1 Tax=Chitinimonas sp. BJB300 TaxID=1559339 RepID=UPI000C0D3C86|nr:DUF2802 domain-containing protein [Chitinimonas sp. BJB300]PHV12473.1 hypothetical protein CSQ89_05425 [Chitinimonas sp. BJB300]TSJ89138.1 DUF2802 domain-containing protein [Chitinimonas sp. BJB300]